MSEGGMNISDVNVPYKAFSDSYVHPGKLVETRSLQYARTKLPSYEIKNPKVKAYLSDAQLDVVAMACEAFETILPSGHRQGFLLGDGAGVGKSRAIFGIMAEILYCQSRERAEKIYTEKAVFITCSQALLDQTQTDLTELDVREPLFSLNDRNKGVPIDKRHGVMFATYSLLITPGTQSVTRLDQLIRWLGVWFEGLIVFDECHNAKRYCEDRNHSTQTGNIVVQLQNMFKKARILYSSATGLSSIENVGYLQRLGLYGPGTPYESCTEFIAKSQLRGVSAMELLVAELGAKGVFIARTLSMEGVEFEKLKCEIDSALYNESTLIFAMVYRYLKANDYQENNDISRFWQAHQRYFAALILSCKINPVVERAKIELDKNNTIVIGLQSTGESQLRNTASKYEMKDDEKYCAARAILLEVIVEIAKIEIDREGSISDRKRVKVEKVHNGGGEEDFMNWMEEEWQFKPNLDTIKKIAKASGKEVMDTIDNNSVEKTRVHARNKYQKTLRYRIAKQCKTLNNMFKLNPIDDLMEKLGGEDVVAELTGRSIKRELNGDLQYDNCSRNSHVENMKEYKDFMDGTKRVAIISGAFSTGVSLQYQPSAESDNGGHRIHVTVELSWSADSVMQQLGRTHRSNQKQPPTYLFVVSNVPGEERFLASITEKLRVLGALTGADQSASGFANFISDKNFDEAIWKGGINDFVRDLENSAKTVRRDELTLEALELVDVVCHGGRKYTPTPVSKVPNKFLNRLLGIPLLMQEWVLDGITFCIDERRRNTSNFDYGIKEYQIGSGVTAKIIEKKKFDVKDGNIYVLNRIVVDKSTPLKQAKIMMNQQKDCLFRNTSTGPAILFPTSDKEKFVVYRPHNCIPETLCGFETRHLLPITREKLEKRWKRQVKAMRKSTGQCAHNYVHKQCRNNNCRKKDVAKYEIYVLTGPLSLVWEEVRKVVYGHHSKTSYLKAVRLSATNSDKKTEQLIGVRIPAWSLLALNKMFVPDDVNDDSSDDYDD